MWLKEGLTGGMATLREKILDWFVTTDVPFSALEFFKQVQSKHIYSHSILETLKCC